MAEAELVICTLRADANPQNWVQHQAMSGQAVLRKRKIESLHTLGRTYITRLVEQETR